ncbi:GNAT family N-acetyltransferase [Sphingobacterium thalpophilum]|uniref:GNAT family N-acetyltransferase n=1 Tax=Sphingobacterium thalpophilum TaxID=259 RepID=UPI003D96F393
MNTREFNVQHTSETEWEEIIGLFDLAMQLDGKNGYKVWNYIDEDGLRNDIRSKKQYKIVQHGDIVCLFSIQYADPHIWKEREQGDALYLHRIVVNPKFKGQKHFEKVLRWAREHAQESGFKFIRMDTWADNDRIINYYKSFGFDFIGNHTTASESELPIQNRNLKVALLQLPLTAT